MASACGGAYGDPIPWREWTDGAAMPKTSLVSTTNSQFSPHSPNHPRSPNAPHSPVFGTELRRWRTLRRVSQLELANRAGTTQRHLSFMEQGRSQPGRPIVLRLAESLRLTLRERNALLFSAGYTPAYEETDYDAPAMAPVREAMERVIEGHLPYPALVLRQPGRVIAANHAFSVFLEGCSPELLTPPINLLRIMLHPDGVAPRVANLPQWGRHVIDNLRCWRLQSPDRGMEALANELAGYVPEAPQQTRRTSASRYRCG